MEEITLVETLINDIAWNNLLICFTGLICLLNFGMSAVFIVITIIKSRREELIISGELVPKEEDE